MDGCDEGSIRSWFCTCYVDFICSGFLLWYREGYSPILVKELIKRSQINHEKMFVADPMMGSGSTLVAAKELGFDTMGIDIKWTYKILLGFFRSIDVFFVPSQGLFQGNNLKVADCHSPTILHFPKMACLPNQSIHTVLFHPDLIVSKIKKLCIWDENKKKWRMA